MPYTFIPPAKKTVLNSAVVIHPGVGDNDVHELVHNLQIANPELGIYLYSYGEDLSRTDTKSIYDQALGMLKEFEEVYDRESNPTTSFFLAFIGFSYSAILAKYMADIMLQKKSTNDFIHCINIDAPAPNYLYADLNTHTRQGLAHLIKLAEFSMRISAEDTNPLQLSFSDEELKSLLGKSVKYCLEKFEEKILLSNTTNRFDEVTLRNTFSTIIHNLNKLKEALDPPEPIAFEFHLSSCSLLYTRETLEKCNNDFSLGWNEITHIQMPDGSEIFHNPNSLYNPSPIQPGSKVVANEFSNEPASIKVLNKGKFYEKNHANILQGESAQEIAKVIVEDIQETIENIKPFTLHEKFKTLLKTTFLQANVSSPKLDELIEEIVKTIKGETKNTNGLKIEKDDDITIAKAEKSSTLSSVLPSSLFRASQEDRSPVGTATLKYSAI